MGGELGCSDRATCSLFEICESRWAGLRRSINTLSLRLLIVMGKVFVCSFDYQIGAIIRRLEWFADRIPSEEDMRGSRESIREVCGQLNGSG